MNISIYFVIPCLCLPGCVERKLTITSEPEGAVVVLNDQEMGKTPLTIDFQWYGDYDVILRKPGRQTFSGGKRLHAPIWQWPILDFVSEVLLPITLRDHPRWHFKLPLSEAVPRKVLVSRARSMQPKALPSAP